MIGNVDLPENGDVWHMLRSGDLQGIDFSRVSKKFGDLVVWMLAVDPSKRPSAKQITDIIDHFTDTQTQVGGEDAMEF